MTIKSDSSWHTIERLGRLLECLRPAGVEKARLYKASGSDDWQLFIFWSDSVPSKDVIQTFELWFSMQNIEQLNGVILHPGSDELIVLPLQAGFAWLDAEAEVTLSREELSLDQAVDLFMKDLVNHSNEWNDVSRTIEAAIAQIETGSVTASQADDHLVDQVQQIDNEGSSTDDAVVGQAAKETPEVNSDSTVNFAPSADQVPDYKAQQLSLFFPPSGRAPPA